MNITWATIIIITLFLQDNPKEYLSANTDIAKESSGWDDFDDWGDTNVIETNVSRIE